MERVCFSEMVESTDESTNYQNPEERNTQLIKNKLRRLIFFRHFSNCVEN
jgi:hypothetical protein